MTRIQPSHEMEIGHLIDWAIQADQALAAVEHQSQEAREARAKLAELLGILKEMLTRGEVAHDNIAATMVDVKHQLVAVIDLQARVRRLEKEVENLWKELRRARRTDKASTWGPITVAGAALLYALADGIPKLIHWLTN